MPKPSKFTQATVDIICERIANGESLRAICKDANLPTTTSVKRWLAKTEPDEFVAFRAQYVRAREDQADSLFDQILDIADEKAADVRRAQLRVDARKWMAGKLQPKKYGDKVQIGSDPDNPLRVLAKIERVIVRPNAPDTNG